MSLEVTVRDRLVALLNEHPIRVDTLEYYAINAAMERHHGCITRAAATLGIGRTTLHRKLKAREKGIRSCPEE